MKVECSMDHLAYLVEDETSIRMLVGEWLKPSGIGVREFDQAEGALSALETTEPSVIILDLGLPGMSGIEALERLHRQAPQVPVVVLTAEKDARIGVQAMKLGAVDYLVKPVDPDLFIQTVETAIQRYQMVLEIRTLRAQLTTEYRLHEIIGQSAEIRRVTSQLGLMLENSVPVLLQGETGTGKELIARIIHKKGARAEGPFVAINCGALPADLQESHFFGHEKGAFTGASGRHTGYFEEASGGTIFLDEVGELTPDAQVKLLRVLQEKVIRRLGSTREIDVDVRVISATNRNLDEMMATGEFREDLFYRLAVFPITVSPLRQRRSDIPLIIGHYLGKFSTELDVTTPELTDAAFADLVGHPWPGNVRELQNVIQYAILQSKGEPIEQSHLPASIKRRTGNTESHNLDGSCPGSSECLHLINPLTGSIKSFEQIEREVFLRAKAMADGSVTRAAMLLGVGRATIYRRLQDIKRHEDTA
jgi:DNA-binding NtrC family response regulator